jgi:hypothetical protein
LDSKILWSLALGIAFILFAANAFWKSKTSTSSATSGFILWQAFDNWLDFALYPTVVGLLGPIHGLEVMFVVTLGTNLAYFYINSKTETDWTFREKILSQPIIKKLVGLKIGSLAIGKVMGFMFFAVKVDSFTAVTYLYGKNVDLRKVRVWVLFLASHATANAAWTLLVGGIFALVQLVLKAISF